MRMRSGTSAVIALAISVSLLGFTVAPAAGGSISYVLHYVDWGTVRGTAAEYITNPSDVATDKYGNIYVSGGDGDDVVQMYDPAINLIDSVTLSGAADGALDGPRGLACDRWGSIYVVDAVNRRVSVFMPELYGFEGKIVGYGTYPDPTVLGTISKIAVGLDGSVYLTDNGMWITRWKRTGAYLGSRTATGPVMGVAVSQEGEVFSTNDEGNVAIPLDGNKVIVYNPTLAPQRSWGSTGSADGLFSRPMDVGVDPAGHVFVLDTLNNRVQVFSENGTFVDKFGSTGPGSGQFFWPNGIDVGLNRTVHVADTNNSRISGWKVATPTDSTQIAGDSRYTTAVEASKRAYPDGAKMVVIATGENWPDALGGAALAGAVNAPLLLTPKNALPADVSAEIIRLNAVGAYILGSESAVSKAVYDAVDDLMILAPPMRLGGADRYATANAIAAEAVLQIQDKQGYDGTAFVVTGENFPDALAASPIAAANGWPIYLTPKAGLPASVKAAMVANASNHGYIIGSTSAVSAAVATELNAVPFNGFSRYQGANRYETAAVLANVGFDGMGMLWSKPALAVGTNFPDALAGGVLQGSDYGLILLTPKDSLDPHAAAALAANKDSIYELRFLGSTAALGTTPRNAAQALLW